MCPMVCGIVTGDTPISYWPIFPPSLSLVTVPGVFAKVNSAQFSSRFERGELSVTQRIIKGGVSLCFLKA